MLLTANQYQVIRIEHILPQRSGTEAAAFNNQVRLELGKLNVRLMERYIAKQELRSMLFYGLEDRRHDQHTHRRGTADGDGSLLIVAPG